MKPLTLPLPKLRHLHSLADGATFASNPHVWRYEFVKETQ